jgi:hypothetical protein
LEEGEGVRRPYGFNRRRKPEAENLEEGEGVRRPYGFNRRRKPGAENLVLLSLLYHPLKKTVTLITGDPEFKFIGGKNKIISYLFRNA